MIGEIKLKHLDGSSDWIPILDPIASLEIAVDKDCCLLQCGLNLERMKLKRSM